MPAAGYWLRLRLARGDRAEGDGDGKYGEEPSDACVALDRPRVEEDASPNKTRKRGESISRSQKHRGPRPIEAKGLGDVDHVVVDGGIHEFEGDDHSPTETARGKPARIISDRSGRRRRKTSAASGDGAEDKGGLFEEKASHQAGGADRDQEPSPPFLTAGRSAARPRPPNSNGGHVGPVLGEVLVPSDYSIPKITAPATKRYQTDLSPRIVTAESTTTARPDKSDNKRPETLLGPSQRKISPCNQGTRAP